VTHVTHVTHVTYVTHVAALPSSEVDRAPLPATVYLPANRVNVFFWCFSGTSDVRNQTRTQEHDRRTALHRASDRSARRPNPELSTILLGLIIKKEKKTGSLRINKICSCATADWTTERRGHLISTALSIEDLTGPLDGPAHEDVVLPSSRYAFQNAGNISSKIKLGSYLICLFV